MISKTRRRSSRNQLAALRRDEQESFSMNAKLEIAPLLTTAEVAGVLKVHPRTLARLSRDVRSKFPQPLRVGHALRWRADQLRTWMEAQQS